MTFDPVEMYRFANWLDHNKPTNPSPVLFRTIVNRAYYSALISAREKGNILTKGQGGHQAVIDYYATRSDIGSRSVVINLGALRKLREEADYELSSKITLTEAKQALNQAKNVLMKLSLIKQDDIGFTVPFT